MKLDASDLAALLEECVPETHNAVAKANCLDRPYFDWRHIQIDEPRNRVNSWIERQSEYEPNLMISSSGGRHIFNHAATALLALALKFGSKEAASWYCSLFSSNPKRGLQIWLLQGVSVKNEIEINDQVSLIPFSEIPDSLMKNDAHEFILSEQNRFPHNPQQSAISTALVASYEFDQRLSPNDSPPEIIPKFPIDKILEGLCLIGPSSVRPVHQWHQTADPMFEFIRSGRSSFEYYHEISWPLDANSTIISESSGAFIQQYCSLAKQHPHLSISVQRLHAAVQRKNSINRAIELGTAIESAISGDGATEIIYRLSLRLARLLGQDLDERREIRSIIKAFYKMRSAAVHTGRISRDYKVPGHQNMAATLLAETAQTYLVRCLKLFVEQGDIPDWEKLELS